MGLVKWNPGYDLYGMDWSMFAARDNAIPHRLFGRVVHAKDICEGFLGRECDSWFGSQETLAGRSDGLVLVGIERRCGLAFEVEVGRSWWGPFLSEEAHGSGASFLDAVFDAFLGEDEGEIEP